MRRGRRKGSMLVFLLAMAMVITIVGGTVLTSIVYTINSNDTVYKDTDLLYATESGIEYGISYIEKNGADAYILSPAWYEVPEAKYNKVDKVEITLKDNSDSTYKLTSRATRNDEVKSLDVTLVYNASSYSPSGNEIFKNGIVASEYINVDMKGIYDFDVTRMTYGDNISIKTSDKSGASKPLKTENQISQKIDSPIFNEKVKNVDSITVRSMDELFRMGLDVNSKPDFVQGGVAKFNVSKPAGYSVEICLVNADKLRINIGEAAHEVNKVIICTGDIEIFLEKNGSCTISDCTIFGKNVSVNGPGAMHMTRAPFYDGGSAGDTLDSNAVNKANDIISHYIPNWGEATSEEISGDGSWEIKNDSYEYN